MLLLIHPVIQATAILLAFYAFLLGVQRTRAFHFKQKAVFPWKRHVLVGKIVFAMLLTGFFVGLGMVRFHWRGNLMTLGHGKMALVILPFILVGFSTGLFMDHNKGRNPQALRIIHGLNNTILLGLLVNQARLGIEVYQLFVAGL